MSPPKTLVALLAVAALLAGCSGPAPAPTATAAADPPETSAAPPSAAPTSTAASAPAPQPSSSSTGGVEPSRPVVTAAPKKLDDSSRSAGADISLGPVRATTVKAASPLDQSGPGLLLTLRVHNTTGRSIDTSFVQVGVANAAGAAGTPFTGAPNDPLAQSVRAGGTAEGTYAFRLDDATSGPVTVLVYVTSGQPVLRFRGRAS